MSIKELNNYCVLNAKSIIVHAGKHCGFGTDYNTMEERLK